MIKNYFKIAWRTLMHNKSYTFINIVGLSVGIAACLLIFLIVRFENSFDNFHPNKGQVYRVITSNSRAIGNQVSSGVPFPTGEALRIDFPQLKQVASIFRLDGSHFTIGNENQGHPVKKFKEDDTFLAENQFFNIFNFDWLAGDKTTALTEPNSVILTQSEATVFFGRWQDAVGKVIKLDNKSDLKVTGILKDPPANTDFHLKVVISYASMKVKADDIFYGNIHDWISTFSGHFCFIVLPANQTANQFNASLAGFVKKHKPAEYVKEGMQLQPLSDMHYNTALETFQNDGFSHQLIDILSLIGLFLLIIACVNFINLATAQAVNRSKEVGIRKVLGSNRKLIIIQFMSETFIIALSAVIIGVAMAFAALPFLNTLLNTGVSGSFLIDPIVILFLGGLLAGVTFFAGFYPAIILSGFNPIAALKSKIMAGKSNGVTLRRALVVLQFCIAQVLVIGTLVIISQMNYFRNTPLGFVKDAVITVPFPNDSIALTNLNTLRARLLQQPGITDVSYSFASPSDVNTWTSDLKFDNSPKKTDFNASLIWADGEYFKLYNLQFVAGSPYGLNDTARKYVVNETFLKKLGIQNPQDAIGKYINLFDNKKLYAPIAGVVKDFHLSSLKNQIPPVVLASVRSQYQVINIKIQPANMAKTLASVKTLWSNTFPNGLYEYQFLDDKIAGFYKSEEQLSSLYKIFAGIAIFISCLGLYGLISFMAIQRTKEVGIRKTLGASVVSIVYLFSQEFTLLILVAFAISAPIGWYFMNKWLEGFVYKIKLGPGIFLLSIAVSVIIAWVTVGYKSIRAALANPVKSLKSE